MCHSRIGYAAGGVAGCDGSERRLVTRPGTMRFLVEQMRELNVLRVRSAVVDRAQPDT